MRYAVFDVETPNRYNDRMSAIGITVVETAEGEHPLAELTEYYYSYVNPETFFDPFNTELTGIDESTVADAPSFPQLWERIEPVFEDSILVAHNAMFDLGVLRKCLRSYGIIWKDRVRYCCTVQTGRKLLPGQSHKLDAMCTQYGIFLDHHHAGSDSRACAEILLRYMDMADIKKYIRTFVF